MLLSKVAANLCRHGLSLAATAELRGVAALLWIDNQAGHGEVRMDSLALIGDILNFVAFVDREPLAAVYAASIRKACWPG
jgi:uncharacterized DUF497 family protein